MSFELIITEKPSAAEKIADALADKKAKKFREGQVSYFELEHNGKPIKIACAVGHLFTVAEKEKGEWTYPVFDLKWVQSAEANKSSDYTKKYANVIKQLAKTASEFTVATDYDIEGEVIGLNIIKYLCKQKDANRMKFSTLTKPDLVKAYANKSKTLDWGQGLAGVTRHELDWYYGINLSRALTQSIKTAGSFKILSSGRVQGPALKILVDKEKEISAFIPQTYWQIEMHTKKEQNEIIALHKGDKIFERETVDAILKNVQGQKNATVTDIQSKQFKQQPPTPFDLTTLQIECHRVHKYVPKDTLSLAQDLYTGGFISYPRTSSQKLPKELGHAKLIENLKRNPDYKILAEKLLARKTLKPNEGKKTDEAHPAIYPTGHIPQKLTQRHMKLYDLIVRRFLATFCDPATRETMTVTFDVNAEPFLTKGSRTVDKQWHEFYGPYAVFEEVTLPALTVAEVLAIKKIDNLEKQTKPPKRYTAASIIKELEKQGLGTKATRASIVESLYNRGYVNEKSIEATDIGIKTNDVLEKYCPRITDAALTRQIEDEMEQIRKKEKTPDQVLDKSKHILTEILGEFKEKEKNIGEELLKANRESQDVVSIIGDCPICKKGTLRIKRGKFGRFIACDSYPDCKTTLSLPKTGTVKPDTDQKGENGYPVIILQAPRSSPTVIELTPEAFDKKKDEPEQIGRDCPKCKEPLIKRKGFYGDFIGCSGYPKCHHMERINKDGTTTVIEPKAKKVVKKKTVKKKVVKKKVAPKS